MGQLGGYQLGIDLGTTYTSAAVCRSDDRRFTEPEVVSLGSRSAAVPSVLFLGPDGSVVVGEAAERRALTDPDRVVREFKRRIGDPTPLVVAGRAWAPEELSARLVRWVVDRVAEREGGPATRIAVTHPASWGPHKRDLLGAALAAQGVSVTFLAEPQAAALHYAAAERVGPGSTIAVYDLGGGTFDAAVVRKAEPGRDGAAFGLLGRPEGLERLGGVDFDELVFEHVREALPEVFGALDPADPAVLAAVARVRRDCTDAKEALSADTEVSIPVLLPGAKGTVRLHRSEFESLVRPLVEETVSALRAAVASARLTPEELTAVLLVGGSSRIPLVAQMVSGQLGRPVAVDADPKNAIAKGAALAVSPKPTASWPGVAVAAVPVGPTVALGAGAVAPPRPAGPPPPRPGRTPYTPPGGVARTAGPVHEPATSLLSGRDAEPVPHRPAVRAPVARPERYEPEDRRRRPLGLLVGAGGILAVAALVVGVLLLGNTGSEAGFDTTGTNGVVPSLPSGVAGPTAPETVPAGPTTAVPGAGSGGGAGATADSGGGATGGGHGGGGGATPTTDAPTAPPTTPPPSDTGTPPTDPTDIVDPVTDPVIPPDPGAGGGAPIGDGGGSTTQPSAEGSDGSTSPDEPPPATAGAV